MKKFILSLGLVAMMLNLTNCAQYEDVNPTVEPQGDFEIYASATRTANDGLNTVWSAGDDLNVFHAVTDGTTYTKDGQFKIDDIETGRFLGNVNGTLDSQEEYDWYATYPYSSYITTPASTNGYQYIGGRSDAKQTQIGNNSMGHIAGKNYPLVGKAYAVPAGTAPSIKMQHVSSLIEFEVVNKLNEAITVSEIKFTAPESLIGTFYVNFADIENISCSNATYTANTATLVVEGGQEIAAGASAKFYMGVKPFTAAAGEVLSIAVSASNTANSEGTHVKDLELTNDVVFSAGKIKNVKVNYTTEISTGGDDDEVSELIDFSKQGYANAFVVPSYESNYCSIAFNKGSNSTAPTYYTTGTGVRVYAGSYFTISSEQKIIGVSFTFGSGEDSAAATTNTISADTGTMTGSTWTGEAESVKFTVAGEKGHRRIHKIQITYKVTNPVIVVKPITVVAEGAEGEASYSVIKMQDDVTVSSASDWISAEAGAGKITYEVEPNYTGAVRTGEIILSSASAGISKSVVVEQAADVFNVNLNKIELGAAANTTAKFTVNSTYPFTIANPNSSKLSLSATSGTGTVEIVVTALTANDKTEILTIGDIVVSRSVDSKSVSVSATQAASGTVEKVPTTATLSFGNKAQRTSFSTTKQVWEQNGIVFTNNKASSSNNVADYANPVRLYAGSSIEVAAPGQISKVEFTVSGTSYANPLKNSIGTISSATVSVSGSTVTITYAAPVDKVTIAKLTAQVRLSSLKVTYLQ